MIEKRMCLLDESKECNKCGECDRCDLDPNKICNNCCECIAIGEDKEFRSIVVKPEDIFENKQFVFAKAPVDSDACDDIYDKIEPLEIDPQLKAYWERALAENGEAPDDDGLSEMKVSIVRGIRKRRRK